ncbi:MAG TPA: hypothetical protein VN476_04875 [Pyrinomonadaceae bacterium]|jgi:hypothetical protein|nr:hypothetical protein [Pyrinomonadaceae bacterium]
MTRKLLPLLAAVALLVITAALVAQDKTVTLDGYMIDNACASSDKAKDKTWIKTHSTSCATMEACEKSGYAVYAKDKLYKFDDAGNASAAEIIKNTKSKKGLHVKVEGTIDGDTIKVTKITEVTS